MMKHVVTVIVVLSLAAAGYTQDIERARLEQPTASNSMGVRPVESPFSLIDFSRIKWSHSYSVSYFSGSGYSGSVGLASTSMFYEFSPKLSLQVNLGILHSPGALWGDENNGATILPGFRLDYHPSDKFHMSIGVQRFDGRAYPGPYGYYSRYGLISPDWSF
ncbi:MAG: hypothetical protein RBT76_00355 [candidate division Zixibacteria bacterium]|jgi:hypothetical protein|nr:hypothetical protein [candidate division Zixibacteria bacterium]